MAHLDVFLTCLRRQSLCSDYIEMSVLDEADKMLSMGFKDQIYDIFRLLPSMVRVGVFSVTNRLGFL
ncbi:putative RNA helicase [Helianthus annuus]|nr:putative RNA helicase [Helianthus annuus]